MPFIAVMMLQKETFMPLSPSPTYTGTTNTHGYLICSGKDLEGHLLSPLYPLTHSCSREGGQPIRSMAPCFLVGGGVTVIHCHVFLEHLHLGGSRFSRLSSLAFRQGNLVFSSPGNRHMGQGAGTLFGPPVTACVEQACSPHADHLQTQLSCGLDEHEVPKVQIQAGSLKLSQGPLSAFYLRVPNGGSRLLSCAMKSILAFYASLALHGYIILEAVSGKSECLPH